MLTTFVLVGPLAESRALSAWAHSEFRKNAAVVFIAVDSGLEPLIASGLPATLVVGDFDGFTSAARVRKILKDQPGLAVLRLDRAKERSDLAIALAFCAKQSAEHVYAFGFQGGRADHDFAVHLDLSEASRRIPRVVSIGEKGATFYLDARHAPLKLARTQIDVLRCAAAPRTPKSRRANPYSKGPRIASLFPVGAQAVGVNLRGLRFKAAGGILTLSSQGLSNEIRAREISVGLRRGRLALFFPKG